MKEDEEKGERIFAKVKKKDEEKARTLRQGIDTFKKKYNFNLTIPDKFEITLKKKTRFKSFYRSLIIPGWGQRYSDVFDGPV